MKKALRLAAPQTASAVPLGTSRTRRTRLAGVLALLAVMAGLGVFAARPAHTAGGPIAVNVANAPLATTPTDAAAPRQPFTAQTAYVIPDGSQNGFVDTDGGYGDILVPVGKRLVIQTVSLNYESPNSETVQAVLFATSNMNPLIMSCLPCRSMEPLRRGHPAFDS